MESKTLIWIGIGVGGLLGSLLGNWLDHGNTLGGWTLLFGGLVGPIAGIWVGYKISND